MKTTTVGIDLAKNVFQVHAVDERGRAVLRKQLRRDQMTAFFAKGIAKRPSRIGSAGCKAAATLRSRATRPATLWPADADAGTQNCRASSGSRSRART